MQESVEMAAKVETLVDLLRYRAEKTSDFRAYTFLADGETEIDSYTYSDLHQRARAFGERLDELGQQGQPVLVVLPAGLDFIAAFFGCLYAGAIAVPAPVPGRRQIGRLTSILTDSGTKVLLTHRRIYADLKNDLTDAIAQQLVHILFIEEVGPAPRGNFEPPAISASSLAFLQYTSGSTGVPKGVMVSHGNLIHNLEGLTKGSCRSDREIGVSWLPQFHDMGLIEGLLSPLYSGYPTINMSPESFIQKPIRWLLAITRYQATTSGGPNFAYAQCLRRIGPAQRDLLDLSSWQCAYNGAELIRIETLQRFAEFFAPSGFRRSALLACYGLAESTVCVSIGAVDKFPGVIQIDPDALKQDRVMPVEADEGGLSFISCGTPIGGQQVVVVDRDTQKVLEEGQVGEIWVNGTSVAQGYWKRPEETESTFQRKIADSGNRHFLNTGDLGFFYKNELYVTGRSKDLIILHGQNHYPQDIEVTAGNAHSVLRADHTAAFSVDHEGEEVLVVVQEVDRGFRSANLDSVVEDIQLGVSETHQVPVHAVILVKPGGVPKTSSGKIQRHRCKQLYLTNQLSVLKVWQNTCKTTEEAVDEVYETLPIEANDPTIASRVLTEWLCERVAIRLGISRAVVQADKSLAHYGLESAHAVNLVSDIRKKTGIDVNPSAIYDYPTVRSLTLHLVDRLFPNNEDRMGALSPPLDSSTSITDLLGEVEALGDEEVARLLSEKTSAVSGNE